MKNIFYNFKNYFIAFFLVFIGIDSLAVTNSLKSTQSFENYYQQSHNRKNSMSQRWRAVFEAAEIAQPNELKKISQLADNQEWYLRNAALLALDKVDQQQAQATARKLIKDKALVVRSSAVDILAKSNSYENRRLLAEEVSKPYNFKRKSSLWIRSQIIERLALNPESTEKMFFAKHLFDQDTNVVRHSLAALEMLDVSKEHASGSFKNKIDYWRKYVKTQKLVN